MIDRIKSLIENKKLLIYISAAVVAIIAAVIAVILLVQVVTNPPDVILNSSGASQISTSSFGESLSYINTQDTPTIKNPDAPKINGIKNGAVYYATQYVTIVDKDLTSVIVNGNAENKSFFIDGNFTNEYVIEATDAQQNTTVFTVYTKPISSLLEPISHLNDNTVTSDYYKVIKDIQNEAFKIDTKYSAPDEAVALNNVITTCDKYINKINYVTEKIEEITNLINQYEQSQAFIDINDVTESIDSLLSTQNLTHEQRLALSSMSSKCYSWMSNLPKDELAQENIE